MSLFSYCVVTMFMLLTSVFLIVLMSEVKGDDFNCSRYQWRCKDGSCISFDGKCDGVVDCKDGSDETHALCKSSRVKPFLNPIPIQRFRRNLPFSVNLPSCPLEKHESVDFLCQPAKGKKGVRPCRESEPHGTIVKPVCKSPKYKSNEPLPYMQCAQGLWNYVARCTPAFECGLITQDKALTLEGKTAKHSLSPWHIGVYRRLITTQPTSFTMMCSGTLISNTVAISVAQCFVRNITLNNTQMHNHLLFTIAAGKKFGPWYDRQLDKHSQKRILAAIHVPVGFRGWETNFQDDIAVLKVSKPFELNDFVRPVCLDFDSTFNDWQLIEDRKGKLSGWAIKYEGWKRSVLLLDATMEFTPAEKCLLNSDLKTFQFITSDKICAGQNSKAFCSMENGGGLVFPETDQDGRQRYYLRGIQAIPPWNKTACDLYSQVLFTSVAKHEHFLTKFL